MPELPEVETIRQNLRLGRDGPALLGMTFSGALVLWERTLARPTPAEFLARLPGQEIQEIKRRGKYLVFQLSNDTLLLHLRMSGGLLVEPRTSPMAQHDRFVYYIEEDWRLSFNDARKFGRVWLVGDPQTVLGHLGPEPLSPNFTANDLFQGLQSRNRQLKPLLLDQAFLAGLGNIYVDEALFLAKLQPMISSKQVKEDQAWHLWKSIRQVLQEGIDHNGASIDWVYRGGGFQNYFRVYRRDGQPCRVCSTIIKRIVVGQRSTHYCPECQPVHV